LLLLLFEPFPLLHRVMRKCFLGGI